MIRSPYKQQWSPNTANHSFTQKDNKLFEVSALVCMNTLKVLCWEYSTDYTLLPFTNSISFSAAPSNTLNSHLANMHLASAVFIQRNGARGEPTPKKPDPTALLLPEWSQLSLNQPLEDLQLTQLWASTLAEPQQHRALWSKWGL